MADIKSMNELRQKLLDTLEKLEAGEVDIQHAACVAKIGETIVSGLRSEMQYSLLIGQQPAIEFYGEQSGIEFNPDKKVLTLR